MDEQQAIGICRSLRFTATGEKPTAGERRLHRLRRESSGDTDVYARPWSLAAGLTLEQIRPSRGRPGWHRHAVAWQTRLHRWLDSALHRNHWPVLLGHLPAEAVVLRRSQKIILIDRRAGWVLHMLPDGASQDPTLLKNECDASGILPDWTIPVLMRHLDEPPYFIMQPYLPYVPRPDWRLLLPDMGVITEALFRFYRAAGWQRAGAATYLQSLHERIRMAWSSRADLRRIPRLEGLSAELQDVCRSFIREHSIGEVILTRVHGDFISSHIVEPWAGPHSRLRLVDWSESHVYSVFHDLFYFHFQNHDSDFWERFARLEEAGWSEYFGAGLDVLMSRLTEEFGRRLGPGEVRFNFMLGFVQELEHRLYRLHPRYIPFWMQQAERALRGVK